MGTNMYLCKAEYLALQVRNNYKLSINSENIEDALCPGESNV